MELGPAPPDCGTTESKRYCARGGHSLRIKNASTVPIVRDDVSPMVIYPIRWRSHPMIFPWMILDLDGSLMSNERPRSRNRAAVAIIAASRMGSRRSVPK